MKRFFALLLCLIMAFALVACDDKDKDGNKNDDDGDSGAKAPQSNVSYYVEYKSVKIELGADASALIKSLGTPTSESSAGNCGGLGTLTKYEYGNDLTIYILTSGSKQTVDSITLKSDTVLTAKGVGIGSSRAEVLEAHGKNPTSNTDSLITYVSGAKTLAFSMRDDTVTKVEYRISNEG